MQVTNTTQNQNTQIKNMQTEQFTLHQAAELIMNLRREGQQQRNCIMNLRRDVDLHSEELALLKAKKSGKSKKRVLTDEEKADKQRLKEEKEAAKAKRLADKQRLKDEKEAAKAKRLADKEAKKLALVKAKEEKEANAGPKIDATYTKKIFVRYANYNENKTANAMTGNNGRALRIARKKDGSDTTVYRHNPNNWPDETIVFFESLNDKWDKKERGFSPDYKPPVKKSSVMAKKIAVEDTDEEVEPELELEMPKEYVLYRKYLQSNKSGVAVWIREGCGAKKGMIVLDKWAYKRNKKDEPFNGKVYDKNPKDEEGIDMKDSEGGVIGNHVKSFVPVVEEKVSVEETEDTDEEDVKVAVEEYVAPTIDEYDENGYKPFEHFDHFGEELKMRRDGAVFYADDRAESEAFIGFLDLETNEIVAERPDSSSDDDSEKDEELFA